MGYEAKIIADSISFETAVRLTTFEITFPRIVLAEFNTHRVLSRSSASSRAIPVEKMIERVRIDPFVPERWPVNGKGMQAKGFLQDPDEIDNARRDWFTARDSAMDHAHQLQRRGIHKQISNRLLEPFLWHTVICTATEYANFFALRCDANAQPEIQTIALMMRDLYNDPNHVPRVVVQGEWHMPYVDFDDEIKLFQDEPPALRQTALARVASARCARISYLTHEGKRDLGEDIRLSGDLQRNGHMAPFEHVAICLSRIDAHVHTVVNGRDFGNFRAPWLQYRKTLPNEAVFVPAEAQ